LIIPPYQKVKNKKPKLERKSMRLPKCNNLQDFRKLEQKKLPSPIFHYIDGAAEDETTYKRNTAAFEECDLVPNVLAGIQKVDMSTTIFGRKLDIPFPTEIISSVPLLSISNTIIPFVGATCVVIRSEEHTSELQSLAYLVCRLLLEKKKN